MNCDEHFRIDCAQVTYILGKVVFKKYPERGVMWSRAGDTLYLVNYSI